MVHILMYAFAYRTHVYIDLQGARARARKMAYMSSRLPLLVLGMLSRLPELEIV